MRQVSPHVVAKQVISHVDTPWVIICAGSSSAPGMWSYYTWTLRGSPAPGTWRVERSATATGSRDVRVSDALSTGRATAKRECSNGQHSTAPRRGRGCEQVTVEVD